MKRNMKRILLAATLAVCWSCDGHLATSPSGDFNPDSSGTQFAQPTVAPDGSVNQPSSPALSYCQALYPIGKDVRVKGASFHVPVVVNVDAEVYIYVWLPSVNDGQKYGPFRPEDFTIKGLAPGTYKFQLAVEGDTNGDKRADHNYQCDRYHGTLTIPEDPRIRIPDPKCRPVEPYQYTDPTIEYGEFGECRETDQGYGKGRINTITRYWTDECSEWTDEVPQRQFEPCEKCYDNVWVVDEEAYDEEVCTEGEPIITGWTYKITGANDGDRRERACEGKGEYFLYSPKGEYTESSCIPGQGVVDGCIFDADHGASFDRDFFNKKLEFEFKCNETEPGEEVCETIHHDEVGHYEKIEVECSND